MISCVAADFVATTLQDLDLRSGIGCETIFAGHVIMSKFPAVRDVLRGDEVCDGHAGFFGHSAQVHEIVSVAIVKSNGHCGNVDAALAHHFDGLKLTTR